MRLRGGLAVVSLLVAGMLAPAQHATAAVTWTKVANGTLAGFSGIAPAQTGWLVVRDNKAAGQNRLALLSTSYQLTSLTWPGTQPQDLEALDAVPGQPRQFVAMTSAGRASVVSVTGTTVGVLRTVTVPRATSNMEAFAMSRSGSNTVAVWANRGSSTQPGKVFAATFNPATGVFGTVATASIRVPFPTANLRQISDVKIVAGRLVISSASDPGSDGPFTSALYDVGSVALAGNRAVLTTTTPASLGTYAGHKIEGIACAGTVGLLGTDDEKQGGSVATASFCG